jgi:serine/threonine protein kinase
VVERVHVSNVTHVRVSGIIDETFSARSFKEGLRGDVIIDLARVHRISSFGVRQWIEFSRELPEGVNAIYVVNATPPVVDQLALVEGFAGVTRLLTLLAPYTCEKCGEDRVGLVDLRADAAVLAEGQAPEHVCSVCQQKLTFADSADEYFAFARGQTVGEVSAEVDSYLKCLQGPETTEEVPGQHLKVIEGDITFVHLAGTLGSSLNPRRLSSGLQGLAVFDFAYVSSVTEPGEAKMTEMFDAAAEGARVYLWRVPRFIVDLLLKSGARPRVKIASLSEVYTCRNCGQQGRQTVVMAEYLVEFPKPKPRLCATCGGPAVPPDRTELIPKLREWAGTDAPVNAIIALEPRALSKHMGNQQAKPPAARPSAPQAPGAHKEGTSKVQLVRRLGAGGMAEVFLARQEGLGGFEKYVVVKRILPNMATSPEFVEMLFAEARLSARLTHPNIVSIYDVGLQGGTPYISMEYVRGPDLRRLMVGLRKQWNQQVPVEHSLRIVHEVAIALHHAHSYVTPTGTPFPVVHRDVSPHNILVSFDGALKLSDFGIAKAIGASEHTQPGILKGKTSYLSPEAVRGEQVDARSDVFSLGVVLYELLTGNQVFRRDSEQATLHAILTDPPIDPTRLNPELARTIANVTVKAIEKDKRQRYQTAGEFAQALDEVMRVYDYRSTPATIAAFFEQRLPDVAAEFAPTSGNASAAPAQATVESTAVTAGGADRGTIRVPVAEEGLEEIDIVGEAAPPRPPPPPARPTSSGSGNVPGRPTPSTPAGSGGGSGRLTAPPQPSPSSRPGRLPESATRPERLPSAPARAAIVPPPQPSHPSPPRRPALAAPEQEKRSSRMAPIVLLSGLVLCALGITMGVLASGEGLLSSGGGDGSISVRNLAPEERLYIGGVRVESEGVRAGKSERLMVGVGRNGVLRRYGVVDSEHGIDVGELKELKAAPGERAPLSVTSDPVGCAVVIAGASTNSRTPLATSIEVGKEVSVEVSCPALPRWSRWVMAAPGQRIELSARMFDRLP